jgi:phosphatidylserine decarboxylase
VSAEARVYRDRATGALRGETVYAEGFLDWLYNARAGRLVESVLAAGPGPSRLYGWLQRRSFSRRRIRPFVERMGIDMSECPRPVESFSSFAEFFTRPIDPTRRPLAADERACLCPVDGKVLVRQDLDPEAPLQVKRATLTLSGLLGDARLARSYEGGALAVCRLGLADYHHVHFPDAGTPGPAQRTPGRYHAGGPYARGWLVPVFAENVRARTAFESDHFGSMQIVEVGALTVGSIRQAFRPGARVERGAHKGWFEIGGSTVVLLFPRGAVAFDADLVEASARGLETAVHMGGPLGRAPGA